MHEGSILVKFAGKSIPHDLLARTFKEYPKCIGMAKAEEGELLLINEKNGFDFAQLEVLLEDNHGSELILFFGNADSDYLADDVQPFEIIKKDDGTPAMVAFAEGGFVSTAEPNSSHSPAFIAVHKELLPKISLFNRMAKGDLDEVLKALNEPTVEKDLVRICCPTPTEKGMMLVLSATGEYIAFGNTDTELEADWGYTTNGFNYSVVEQKVEEKQPEPQKIAFMKKQPSVPSVSKAEVNKALDQPVKTDTAAPPILTYQYPAGAPQKAKNIINSYRHKCGVTLTAAEALTRPVIPLKVAGMAAIAQAAKPAADLPPPKTTEKETPLPDGVHKVPAEPKTSDPNIPLIPTGMKEQVQSFLGEVDHNSQKMGGDPTKAFLSEAKLPIFVDQVSYRGGGGKGFDATLGWFYGDYLTFARKYPEGAATMMKDFRNEIISLRKTVSGLEEATAPVGDALAAEGNIKKIGFNRKAS